MGEVLDQYYQAMLGSLKATILIDVKAALNGPCLDDNSHAILLAILFNAVIKEAHYNIDNDKTTCCDGHTSLFFKKAWFVVGNDFCVVVNDFFTSRELLKQVNH